MLRFRDGDETDKPTRPDLWRWTDTGDQFDIIAYCVASPLPSSHRAENDGNS